MVYLQFILRQHFTLRKRKIGLYQHFFISENIGQQTYKDEILIRRSIDNWKLYMGKPRYNATTPHYDRLHYNHSAETAALLCYFERNESCDCQLLQVVDPQGGVFERVIQHSCNIFSEQSNYPLNVGWIQFYDSPEFVDAANRIRQFFHEIRTGADAQQVEKSFVHKILLPKMNGTKAKDFFEIFIQPALGQIARRTILIVIDLTLIKHINMAKLSPLLELLEVMVSTTSLTKVKAILAVKKVIPYKWGNNVLEVEPLPKEISEYFASIHVPSREPRTDQVRHIEDQDLLQRNLLAPLRILNSGAEKEVLSFLLQKWTNSNEDQIWPLLQKKIVKRLVNRGISLDHNGITCSGKLSAQELHKANNCKVLSFQPPELLLESDTGIEAIMRLEEGKEFMVNSVSLLMEGLNYNDLQKWDFILDRLSDVETVALYASQIALSRYKILLSYLTQIIISREELDDPRLFKALEIMTDNYAQALVAQKDVRADDNHEAARSYYNLYYLMSRTYSRRPRLFNLNQDLGIDDLLKEFAGISTRYQEGRLPSDYESKIKHSFHIAWYKYENGLIDESAETFFDLANTCIKQEKKAALGLQDITTIHSLYAYDCTSLAFSIKPSLLSTEFGSNLASEILARYGGFTSIKELSDYLKYPTPRIYDLFPNNAPAEQVVVIHFSHYDWLPALQIADSVAFSLGLVPRLSHTENGGDFLKALSIEAAGHVVLGSPDSPGKVGEFVANIDKDLSSVYQSCLGEDFFLPIPTKYLEQDVIILMASGLRGIIESWVMAVGDTDRFPLLKRSEGEKMPIDIFSTFLGGVFSKAGENISDMLTQQLTKRVNSNVNSLPEESALLEQLLHKFAKAAFSNATEVDKISIQERLQKDLQREQKREVLLNSDVLSVVSLVRERLDEIRGAGADVEPRDYEVIFISMITIVDEIIEKNDLRSKTCRALESYNSTFLYKQSLFDELQSDLNAGKEIRSVFSKECVKLKTVFNNFENEIKKLLNTVKG